MKDQRKEKTEGETKRRYRIEKKESQNRRKRGKCIENRSMGKEKRSEKRPRRKTEPWRKD